MRWGWLLPDASYQVLYDGWERQPYRPRHGKPPFVIRGAYSAAMAFSRARERYLGAVELGAVELGAADEDYAAAAGLQAAAARAPLPAFGRWPAPVLAPGPGRVQRPAWAPRASGRRPAAARAAPTYCRPRRRVPSPAGQLGSPRECPGQDPAVLVATVLVATVLVATVLVRQGW